MEEVVARHHSPGEIDGLARERLREIEHDLETTYVPYDEWVTLDRSFRRLREELGEPSKDEHCVYP